MEFISLKENFQIVLILCAIAVIAVYKKRGLAFLVSCAAIVGLNDFISHNLFKEIIARPRPCHTLPDFQHIINCSNSFSFPSNHASNTFTAATLIGLCFRNMVLLAYSIAFLVGYSRVYLAVHYPSDVLAGAICGIVMGWLGFKLYQKICKYFHVRHQT